MPKREQRLELRLSDEEAESLEQICQTFGLTKSQFLRAALFNAEGRLNTAKTYLDLGKIYFQLSRIAHQLSQNPVPAGDLGLQETLDQLQNEIRIVREEISPLDRDRQAI